MLYDPQDKLYKMWYADLVRGVGWIHNAESQDGKSWRKPELGLVELDGSKANNCIWRAAELPNVFLDPIDADPRGRLKMYLWARPFKVGDREVSGHVLLRSGDGIRWEYVANRPAVGLPKGDETGSARTVLDTNQIVWDPIGQRYLGTFRLFPLHPGIPGWFRNERREMSDGLGGHRRAAGVAFSQKLDSGWSRMTTALKADAKDDEKAARLSKNDKLDWAELYIMPVFTYGNQYFGMVSLLHWVDGIHGGDTVEGSGDLQFTFSHDGATWFRQPDRQTMVAPATPGMVPCYAQCNEPLVLGDELWIYYTEAEAPHPKPHHKSNIRAATWRKDGFVSLDAAGKGRLTTHPLVVAGKRLHVNFEGRLVVTLLDDRGLPLKDFPPQTFRANATAAPVEWDLSGLSGKAVHLRFELENGRLWSFRFAPEGR